MKFLFLDLLDDTISKIIIAVFLHSLWQGLVLSVVAWLLMRSTKKWSSAARYNLLVSFLITFLVCIFLTVLSFAQQNDSSFIGEFTWSSVSADNTTYFLQPFMSWCTRNATSIFMIWFFVFMFKVIQLVQGLIAVDKLGKMGVSQLGCQWPKRVNEMKLMLNIRKKVNLAESSLILQPSVIGFLKPIILMPVGLVNGLRPQEVEAILLHELAHIKRNDYLVNLFQCFLETCFFFNPFLYWLSEMIRDEREHCCDALVVEHTNDRKLFLEALLSSHQPAKRSTYAMGFLGRNNLLIRRINRIVDDKVSNSSRMEKISLLISYSLLFACIFSFSFINKSKYQQMSLTIKKDSVVQNGIKIIMNRATEERPIAPGDYARVSDTTPKKNSTSKEFHDGYMAGKLYKSKRATLADDKKKLEQLYADQNSNSISMSSTEMITSTSERNSKDKMTDNQKKRLEQKLIMKQNDSKTFPVPIAIKTRFDLDANDKKRKEESLAQKKN